MNKQDIKCMSVEDLKRNFPTEWSSFVERLEQNIKPSITVKEKKELVNRIDSLRSRLHELPATASRPFVIHFESLWEEDWHAQAYRIHKLAPRKGATVKEKRLISLLGEPNEDTWHEYCDELNDTKFVTNHNRDIDKLKKEVHKLETDYDLNVDELFEW